MAAFSRSLGALAAAFMRYFAAYVCAMVPLL
jgi:hypothetical protein